MKKVLAATLAAFLGSASAGCNGGGGDDNNLLLGLLLLSSASGPRYEALATTISPTQFIDDYYGVGTDGYIADPAYTATLGPGTSPQVIVQAAQAHLVPGGYVDLKQQIDGGMLFLSRNAPLASTFSSTMHWYGSNTSIYSSPVVTNSNINVAAVNNFAVIGPSTNAFELRTVRSLVPATAEENAWTPDLTTTDHSNRGMSQVWSSSKKLRVHLIFLSGANPAASTAGIASAIQRMVDLYSQDTVKIVPEISSTTINEPSYLTLSSLDSELTTAGSLGGLFVNTAYAQRPDALNIYFVKSETDVGGVLGIAGGIPGLPHFTGTPMSAMVLMFDSHLASPGVAPDAGEQALMGETMAHEGGHWLGLWHPVESNYDGTQNTYTRDAIQETPRCTVAGVPLVGCDGTTESTAGARNLMFYTGTVGFAQPDLTGEQGWVLRRHPLVY